MADPITETCRSCGAPPRQHCECLDEPPAHHFNGLSPEVAELLAILAEECGEVVQRIGKILRHGIRVNPYSPADLAAGTLNTAKLEDELADIETIMSLLDQLKVIDIDRIVALVGPKIERLSRPGILHHSSLLSPTACHGCGSTEHIQKEFNNGDVLCVDRAGCVERQGKKLP